MKVAMVTSVSADTPWQSLTTPNHAEWCHRHGATYIARHLPYDQAVADFLFVHDLLDHFDLVWCLDSDAVVTNMQTRLDDISFRPGMNVCEEGLHPSCPINCGSVVWTSGKESQTVLLALSAKESEWRRLTWIWQQWVAERLARWPLEGRVTVHQARTFNSCHHGDRCLWRPGDFVYHPCGMPHSIRIQFIREQMEAVVR